MSDVERDTKGREYMRWPREGESMGAYREYIKRLLVDYGEVVSADQLPGAIEENARLECALTQAQSRLTEGDVLGARQTISGALGDAGGR